MSDIEDLIQRLRKRGNLPFSLEASCDEFADALEAMSKDAARYACLKKDFSVGGANIGKGRHMSRFTESMIGTDWDGVDIASDKERTSPRLGVALMILSAIVMVAVIVLLVRWGMQ